MFSVGPGVKHLTNVLLGGGIFEPSFFYRRGMWRYRPLTQTCQDRSHVFHFTHVPYSLEIKNNY